MLPGVEHEDRDASLRDLVLMIVDLRGAEPLDHRIPDQRRPARAHHGVRGLDELLLEAIEAPEVAIDELRELTRRLPARARREVPPEDAVQDVAAHVEGELLLERPDSGEIRLLTGVEELLDDLVGCVHVLAMMLVVVQLHDAAGDVRLEGAVVVGQIGQDVAGHVRLLFAVCPPSSASRAPLASKRSCKRASARAAA